MKSSSVLAALLCGALGCVGASNAQYAGLPCRVEVGPISVILRGDSTITLSEPAGQVVRDSRGRFYTGSTTGGEILAWSPTGRIERVIGRPGDGPGELARGTAVPFVAPGDTLFVRDDHLHWVVFSPEGRFVREAGLGPMLGTGASRVFFDANGRIVSAHQRPADTTFAVVIADHTGRVLHRLLPQVSETGRPGAGLRPIADAGDGTFWLGPLAGPAAGYTVQRIDTTGRVLQTIHRDVDWFESRPGFVSDVGEAARATNFPYPSVAHVRVDSRRLIWVTTVIPKGARSKELYLAATGIDERREIVGRVLESHYEVFEPGTLRLLGALVWTPSADSLAGVISDGPIGYRFLQDSATGRRTIALFPFLLRDAGGGSCTHASTPHPLGGSP